MIDEFRRKVLWWCDTILLVCVCSTIFYIPISIAILEIAATIMFIVWLFKRSYLYKTSPKKSNLLQAFAPVPTILNKPIWLTAAVILIGVFFSLDPSMSFKKFIVKYAQLMFTYFIFVEVVDRRSRLWAATYCMVGSLIPVMTDGIYQYIMQTSMVYKYAVVDGRLTSTFHHANDLGTYLVTVFPFLISLWIRFPRSALSEKQFLMSLPSDEQLNFELDKKVNVFQKILGKIFIIISSIIVFFLLIMTYSRSAWLAFFISLILLGIRGKKIVRGLMLALVFALCFFMIFPHAVKVRSDVIPPTHSSNKFFSFGNRTHYWGSAMQVIAKYPLFGSGYNTYVLALEKFKLKPYEYAHNGFLQIAAETGLLGLATFIWVIVCVFAGMNKVITAISDRLLKALFLGSLISIFAFLTNSFFDTGISSIQLSTLLWILFGFSVAIRRIALKEAT